MWRGLLVLGLMACCGGARAQGLLGIPRPNAPNPQALALEQQILAGLNRARQRKGAPPLSLDAALASFARKEAELAAKGDPLAKDLEGRIKRLGLAPHGHFFQHAYGYSAEDAVKRVLQAPELLGELHRVGIGAFHVPDTKPYFQIGVLAVKDLDPMLGKPGLSQADTDPVMAEAAKRVNEQCYTKVLQSNPNARFDVVLQIVIGAGGKVHELTYTKPSGDRWFDGCAQKVVQGATFPPPYKGKPVTLLHPMRFQPPPGQGRVGKLEQRDINGAFRSATYDYQKCYDRAAAAQPGLAGELVVTLVVDPAGNPTRIALQEDTLQHTGLSECVRARTEQVRFPRPQYDAPVAVRYPLRFSPPKPAKR